MAIDYGAAGAALRGANAPDLTPVMDGLAALQSSVANLPAPDLDPVMTAVASLDTKVSAHSANFDAFVTGILGSST